MSDSLIWWIGLIHVSVYAGYCSTWVLTSVIWKLHSIGRFNGRILQWHIARARWSRRHTDGLTEAEWQRGEPRP